MTTRPNRFLPLAFLLVATAVAAPEGKKGQRAPADSLYPMRFEQDQDANWTEKKPATEASLLAAAARIDRAFTALQKTKGVKPLGAASDEVFLRRAFYTLAGRPPTEAERRGFLEDASTTKRRTLVIRLSRSEDWTRNTYNYVASLLRVTSTMPGGGGMPQRAYENWIKASLRQDMPWDVFVRKLITADGPASEENGATGYVIRDSRQGILDHVSMTSAVFLSSQIGCAMCHNAKFEKWKQTDFYAMTAYFCETTLTKDPATVKELNQKIKAAAGNPKEVAALQKQQREIPYIVRDRKGVEQKLPADFKYDPEKRGAVISPTVLYGDAPLDPGVPRRVAFARWLTSPENPNFTRSMANRHFARMFGVGIFEPEDDLNEETTPLSKELLDEAAKVFVDLRYSQRDLTAVFALTEAFSRDTSPEPIKFERFAGQAYPLRRLSAEQLWDSLATLFLGDAIRGHESDAPLADAPPPMNDMGNMSRTLAGEEGTSMMSMSESGGAKGAAFKRKAPEKQIERMAAAGKVPLSWDLPQPVRPGSFLDQFGASLRESVSTGAIEPAVIQTLSLMNGSEVNRVASINPKNALFQGLIEERDADQIIRNLYVRILGREPDAEELGPTRSIIRRKGGPADLAWTLINQGEFLFYR